MARTGSASFSFGLTNGQGGAHVHSVVSQAASPTPLTSQVTEASLYAWSNASSIQPTLLNVQVLYSDASPSYFQAHVSGSQNDFGPTRGWRYLSFKSSLRPGATVSGVVLSTDGMPFVHDGLWVDDVSIVAKYQIHPL